MTTAYVESSALAKLALDEVGSDELRSALGEHDRVVSSDLTTLEVSRAARRAGGDRALAQARATLLRVSTVAINRMVIEAAAGLEPSTLRSLDAIHVATALLLRSEDLVFYSYDARTLAAAKSAGLTTASP